MNSTDKKTTGTTAEEQLIVLHQKLEKESLLRKEAERGLEAISANFDRIGRVLDSSNTGIWDWNIPRDEVYYSSRWKEMLGYSDHELPNRFSTWQDLLHPEDKVRMMQEVKDFLENPEGNFEHQFRMKHKIGHYVWILNRSAVTLDEEGQLLFMSGSHTDISAIKVTESNLLESERKLRSIVDRSTMGIATVSHQGKPVFMNDSICRILGYTRDELSTMTFPEFTHPEDVENALNKYKDLLDGKTNAYTIEKRYIHKDGDTVWCNLTLTAIRDESDKILYAVAIVEDISERKKAELALRESERKFHSLYNHAPDMYASFSPDTSRILECNTTLLEATGYSREEVIGRPIFEMYDEGIMLQVKDTFREFRESGVVRNKLLRLKRKDGSLIEVSLNVNSIRDEEGNVVRIISSWRDISLQREQEKAIVRNAQLNEALLDLYRLEDKPEKEFVQYALDKIVTLSGSEIGYMHFFDEELKEISLVSWSTETHKLCTASYDNHYPLKKAGIWADSVRLRKAVIVNDYPSYQKKKGLPDGHFPLKSHMGIPVFEGKRIVGIIGLGNKKEAYTGKDVDQLEVFTQGFWEQLKAIRTSVSLRNSEERFRLLFENMNEGFALLRMHQNEQGDPSNCRYVEVNPAYCRMMDLKREEIVGKTLKEVCPTADPATDQWISMLNTLVRPGQEVSMEFQAENLDKWFSIHAFHAFSNHFGITMADTSEKERQKKVLESTLGELTRSNNELEQFAYVTSHDLQEPLRKVKNYVDLLEARYKDQLDQRASKYISIASDGTMRMQRLIDDLLSLSRVTTQGRSFKEVPLDRVVDNVLDTLELKISEENISIKKGKLPVVMADEVQMNQLFQNLISNAVKFRSEKDPVIRISATGQKNCWQFKIKDNGIGFDMQHADRIFKVFQRLHTREEYNGTGIGLAVCQKIIERHGGRIWAESNPGKGASFHFTINKALKE